MADLGTATIRCTLGAGYIDTSEAERLEGEIAGKDAEIAALEAKIVELNGKIETARADALAVFASVIDRSAVNPELPEGLTKIGDSALQYCYLLQGITLPDAVTNIEKSAFAYCNKLSKVELPESLTSIKSDAFSGCNSLRVLELPSQLESIGDRAFANGSLIQIEFPASLMTLGSNVFMNVRSLHTITFKGTPTTISVNAFSGMNASPLTVNVPWAEGEVSGAPWGARNATINYNYTGGDT